jgi:hypothetical protein
MLTVQGAMPREKGFKQVLCAGIDGFSLHAAVRCAADDRQALEQLCRYITRPALANERVQTNAAGQVVLKLKTAWRDGTTHLVMLPLEFMQRLAALVPRPQLHRPMTASGLSISAVGYWVGTRYRRTSAVWQPNLIGSFRATSSGDWLAGPDPNLTAGLLQSGPTASHDFSCFASTKRPFVISHTRGSADVYGDRVGDGTRLIPVTRLRKAE